jgi:two-component system phosphate regulon response regulator PhoB
VPRATRRILVADGNPEAVASTAFALAGAGYRVSTVLTADQTLHALRHERYDLVVLSEALGGLPGIDVLETLRSRTHADVFGTRTETVGVVMIVDGHDDHEAQRYLALSHGADDVLAHPFSTRELLLRIASILRRAANALFESPDIFRLDELYVDFAGHHVMVDDEIVDLTRKEFALLRTLVENAGRLCTRARLEGTDDETRRTAPSRSIDMHVLRLRRKLGTAGEMIESVRGEGYRLAGVRSRAHS